MGPEQVGKGQVGKVAAAELGHLLVQLSEDQRDLALGDPRRRSERPHQVVDLARGDPVDVGLHDDGVEGLINAPAALQDAREEAPLAQLGDLQLHVAGLGGEQARA